MDQQDSKGPRLQRVDIEVGDLDLPDPPDLPDLPRSHSPYLLITGLVACYSFPVFVGIIWGNLSPLQQSIAIALVTGHFLLSAKSLYGYAHSLWKIGNQSGADAYAAWKQAAMEKMVEDGTPIRAAMMKKVNELRDQAKRESGESSNGQG